jgi:hypothetical protein
VLGEDAPSEGVDLAKGGCPHSGSFKPEGEASDTGKEVEDIH